MTFSLGWENTINSDALNQYYTHDKKSIRNIAKEYGCAATTIKHYLLKYSIPIRTSCEGRKIFLTKDIPIDNTFSEILDGLLLGDGNIQVPNNFQGIYSQASSQKEFIDYVANIFKQNNYYQDSGEYIAHIKNIDKQYPVFYIHSKRTLQLSAIYNRWYPDGKKHVPADIKLTPITVLFWYLGDGHKIKHARNAELCTYAFPLNEQQLLVNVFEEIGIAIKIMKSGKYNILYITANSFDSFMHYMGRSPVVCYNHKFSSDFKCVVEI